MHFENLALEIQLQIMQFCSHSDLCSLAQVHSSLRDAAECVIYSHIYFCAWPFDLIRDQTWKSWELKEDRSLLHTLASNTRKAAMVKVLYIEFEQVGVYNSKETLHSILIKLSEALPNMSNLIDLRVVYDHMLVDPSDGVFSRAIRGDYFKLDTLFLAHTHDLEGIIVDQPHLRLLGIYYDSIPWSHLTNFISQLFRSMESHRRTMPIFMLDCSARNPVLDILPLSHRPGKAHQVCRDIAMSLRKCPRGYYQQDTCRLTFDLFGITDENISLFHEAAEAMAIYLNLLNCPYLSITIREIAQKPWQSSNFIKSLTQFKTVHTLTFYTPQTEVEDLEPLLQDLVNTRFIRDLRQAWPNLQQIVVLDQTLSSVYFDHPSGWRPSTKPFWEGTPPVSDDDE